MTDLHKAAQQALNALSCIEYGMCGITDGPSDDTTMASMDALRAALAQQEEPKGGGRLPPPLQAERGQSAVRWAPSSACEFSALASTSPSAPRRRQRLAFTPPHAGHAGDGGRPTSPSPPVGPADNGHDRSIPPHPYLCTKCMAEMPQPSYNATVVDDAHPNGIPLEQWQNKPVQKPVAWRYQDARGNYRYRGYVAGFDVEYAILKPVPLFTAPPQRKPLTDEEIYDMYNEPRSDAEMVAFARAVEAAHGIKERV
jgi:hypothetical protein